MKVGVIAASVAALATMAFASAAMATNGDAGRRVIGPAGYDQGSATLVIAGGVPTPTVGPGDQVVICHAVGEANKNTYVQIAPSAGVVFGHAGAGHQNGEDIIPPFIYQPNGRKPANTSLATGQNWDAAHIAVYQNGCAALPPPPPPITDLCPNIEGNQETVPVGMVRDAHGNCVAHPDVVVTPTVETPSVPTPEPIVVGPAPVVATPVTTQPVSAVLGVSKTKITEKVKAKKAKAKKAKAKKAKAKKAKAVKAKVASVRVLPFTP